MTNLNKNSKKAFSLVEISIVILIIGLLIAGISKASDLIFDANIATGRSITKSAKVSRIPSLVLWLETTLPESMKDSERGNGSTVSVWRDINPQSTTKFIFRGNGTPTYVEPGKNLPAIGTLTGSNFFTLGTETATAVLSHKVSEIFTSSNATIFMVLKSSTASVTADLFSFCPAAACAAGTQISLGLAAGKPTFIFPGASGASVTATTANDYFGIAPNVIIVSAVKDSVGNKIAVNGASAGTGGNTNTVLPDAFSTGLATFKIGGVGAATGVEIYEIIVFSSTLGDGDRRSVEAYLGKKYNTTMAQGVVL